MGLHNLFMNDVSMNEQEKVLEAFWVHARNKAKLYPLDAVLGADDMTAFRPPAFSGSDDKEEADAFCQHFLDGELDELVTPRADLPDDFPLPEVGEFSILLDGSGEPQMLLRTRQVDVHDDTIVERYEILYHRSDDE